MIIGYLGGGQSITVEYCTCEIKVKKKIIDSYLCFNTIFRVMRFESRHPSSHLGEGYSQDGSV